MTVEESASVLVTVSSMLYFLRFTPGFDPNCNAVPGIILGINASLSSATSSV